jgi:hypothetical protein
MLRYGTVAPRPLLSAALRMRLAAWLIGLTAIGCGFASPAGAAPEAPPALMDWLRGETATTKAADERDSSSTSGLPALNGNLNRSFSSLRTSGPSWLDRVDVGVHLQQDLSAAYRVGTVQPLLATPGNEGMVETRTWLAYDALGNRSGALGFGYRSELQDERFQAAVYTRAEENRANDLWRYVFGGNIGWSALQLNAHLINKVAQARPRGRRFEDSVDSYRIELRSDVPTLPWARVGASRFWDAAPTSAGTDTNGYSLRLWMQPFRPVVLETGADDTNHRERDWFACLRLQLRFD